jgi:hypothetical protein
VVDHTRELPPVLAAVLALTSGAPSSRFSTASGLELCLSQGCSRRGAKPDIICRAFSWSYGRCRLNAGLPRSRRALTCHAWERGACDDPRSKRFMETSWAKRAIHENGKGVSW